MIKASLLPIIETELRPRCHDDVLSGTVQYRRILDLGFNTRYGSYPDGSIFQCRNQSTHQIGDKFYCKKHAGNAALVILMESSYD